MKKNRIRICGRNTSTLPTPAMMPSTSRLRSAPSGSDCCTHVPSAPTTPLMKSIGTAAQLKTAWNTKNRIAARIAGPAIGCITSASRRASACLRSGSV